MNRSFSKEGKRGEKKSQSNRIKNKALRSLTAAPEVGGFFLGEKGPREKKVTTGEGPRRKTLNSKGLVGFTMGVLFGRRKKKNTTRRFYENRTR